MNGRLYDPVVGRFLNADPFIQDAGFTQNYNRYSYCLNNPLKYSDPSGYIKENPLPREERPPGVSSGSGGFYGNGLYNAMAYSSVRYQYLSSGSAGGIGSNKGGMGPTNEAVDAWFDGGLTGLMPLSEFDQFYEKGVPITVVDEVGRELDWTRRNGERYLRGVKISYLKYTISQKNSPAGQGGENFSLAGMYLHFQVGGTKPMTINSASLDFSGTSQRQLGLTGMKQGESREGNLFKTGINAQSLAFGRLEFTYQGNNQFSITNNMFDFDYQAGQSFSRNAGTILGGAVNYNVFPSLLLRSPIPTLVPMIFGGPYNVIFNGNVTIPQ